MSTGTSLHFLPFIQPKIMVDWRLCQRSYGKRQDTPTSLLQGENRDSLPVTLAFTPTINLDLPVKLTCISVNPILNMNIHFCLKQWSLANLKSINILHWKHWIWNKHNSINYKNAFRLLWCLQTVRGRQSTRGENMQTMVWNPEPSHCEATRLITESSYLL